MLIAKRSVMKSAPTSKVTKSQSSQRHKLLIDLSEEHTESTLAKFLELGEG